MPRMLTPMKVDSFPRTSHPSLLGLGPGSRTSSGRTSTGSGRTSAASHKTNRSRGSHSQFSLSRKRTGGASTNSLRRQKSSRQNSLLSYMKMEEPNKQNAEWNLAPTQAPPQPPKTNALWDIVNQGAAGQPSLASSSGTSSSGTSSSSTESSQNTAIGLHFSGDDGKTDLLRGFGLHRASPRRPTDNASAFAGRTILHPTGPTDPARTPTRRNSFVPPSQIKEEDAWGHFVETVDDDDEPTCPVRHGLYAARRHPASLSHLAVARAW